MKTLTRKLAEVVSAVKHPPKSGNNKFHKYDYSTRDDIFGAVRGELASRGVSIFPEVLEVVRCPVAPGEMNRVIARMRITLCDSETGENFAQLWEGESHTKDEKGVPQAVTQALRFWAVNTFMLLDGSDEQLHGNVSTPAQNVQRQEPPTNPLADLASLLKGLGYDADQVKTFGAGLAIMEETENIQAIPEARLRVLADNLSSRPEAEAKSSINKVMGLVKSAA